MHVSSDYPRHLQEHLEARYSRVMLQDVTGRIVTRYREAAGKSGLRCGLCKVTARPRSTSLSNTTQYPEICSANPLDSDTLRIYPHTLSLSLSPPCDHSAMFIFTEAAMSGLSETSSLNSRLSLAFRSVVPAV